jgi:hypothetical protein
MRPANEIPFSKETPPVKKPNLIIKLAAGICVFMICIIALAITAIIIILLAKALVFTIKL